MRRFTVRTTFAALLLCSTALIAACGGGSDAPAPAPTPPPAPPPSVERNVLPAATDAAITTDLEAHVAINPSPAVAARGRLFVFLPGTGGTPANYRLIVRTGAAQGFHSVGLNYPNGEAVNTLCQGSADADCHGQVRHEILTGEARSPLVDVNAANSINNRLARLLTFLHAQAPTEGWNQYLLNGAPDWSRIRVAGHSQGGGHAGYIAKQVAVDRAIYFASGDFRSGVGPATWTTVPGMTPAARQFGFAHLQDPLVNILVTTAVWRALGLDAFGPAVSVDTSTPPYGGSHQLVTDAAPATGPGTASPFHGAPVQDNATPRTASGTLLFEAVWIWLCFS